MQLTPASVACSTSPPQEPISAPCAGALAFEEHHHGGWLSWQGQFIRRDNIDTNLVSSRQTGLGPSATVAARVRTKTDQDDLFQRLCETRRGDYGLIIFPKSIEAGTTAYGISLAFRAHQT